MKRKYSNLILMAVLISLAACTKEITVDVAHEPQTIIFGGISNKETPIVIQVQQSVPLNASQPGQPVNDAKITLFTRNASGNDQVLTNSFGVNQGTYTSNHPIAGTIGQVYWIEVVLADGTRLKSEEERMKPVVPISSFSFDQGFLNVEFSDPPNERNFYTLQLVLLDQKNVVGSVIVESNDVVFDGNENASLELDYFIGQQTNDQQFIALSNINFGSYQFFLNRSSQQESNENNTPDEDGGSSDVGDPSQLFSTPPVSVLGNITNTTNGKRVLGNFTVNAFSIVEVNQ